MPKTTVIIHADSPEEMKAFDSWLNTWQSSLASISENQGCGCCTNIFELDASDEAIDALPYQIVGAGNLEDLDITRLHKVKVNLICH